MAKLSKEKIHKINLAVLLEPKKADRIEINQDEISELAKSIFEIGQLQPIIARPVGDKFEIVAGHRRFLACSSLEAGTVDAIVKEMTDEMASLVRATENLQRAELTPIEEAEIYSNLINNHGMTIDQVGKKMGRTGGTIKRRLDLLKMHPMLQSAVHKKLVSMTVAEELWPISSETDLDYYLQFAIENGITKEVARQWCKEWKDAQRRQRDVGEGSTHIPSVNEPRPIYISCDICKGAVELGKDTIIRLCPDCHETIRKI